MFCNPGTLLIKKGKFIPLKLHFCGFTRIPIALNCTKIKLHPRTQKSLHISPSTWSAWQAFINLSTSIYASPWGLQGRWPHLADRLKRTWCKRERLSVISKPRKLPW
jgi:hypothetical protein